MILSINQFFTLSHISSLSIIVPLLVGFYTYKRNIIEQRILFLYIVLATITEVVAISLASRGINNLPLLHFFTVLEFAFFVWFFKYAFARFNVRIKGIILILSFVVFAILNIVFLENIYSFNTNARSLESLTLILISGYFLYCLLSKSKVLYITEYPNFLATAGILFYFSGTLFLFASSRIFLENWLGYYPAIWSIHAFFNIGFNLLLAKTLWSRLKE